MAEQRPPKGFIDVQKEVSHLFQDFVRQPWSGVKATVTCDWQPCCDLAETDDALIVEVELPEVSCDQIQVTVEGDRLDVTGECQSTTERQGRHYHMLESQSGRFARQLLLPCRVVAAEMQVAYLDGILVVTLPKPH